MTIQIPKPHGDAIAERTRIMQAVLGQFQLLRTEDKRHIDAVLRVAGLRPEDYEQYDLQPAADGENWLLALTPKPQAAAGASAAASGTQHVNGAAATQ